MSDDEYATTSVAVEKPKRERTPAQKEATRKALEALASHREAKKAEKAPTVVKRTTTTTKTVAKPRAAPRPAQNVVEYEDEEYVTAPSGTMTKAAYNRLNSKMHPQPAPEYDYLQDINGLKAGLHGVIDYLEEKEAKKASRKKKVVIEESDSSDTEEEEVIVKKKKKTMKKPEATPEYKMNDGNPQQLLQSIFWRNM